MYYRKLLYFATVLTGIASLCGQVVWQRYLSILIGSEARSLSLVVAIFLFGLASGYYVFARIVENNWSRSKLLKFYGWTELLTAIYLSFFTLYFHFLKDMSFQTEPSMLSDIGITLLALFLPTFLMGASIPVLTTVIPESETEINQTHTKVYGWNTLGAFLGTLLSGFYFIPKFGLPLTLIIASTINLVASLIFIGNYLDGKVYKKTELQAIPSKTPNVFYMIFVFLTGASIIGLEILLIRLLNLSVGSSVYNFPIILSLFIGGLALGSLSIQKKKLSSGFLISQTLISFGFLSFLYFTAPYWPVWISHIRVSLYPINSNYYVFKFLIYLFMALFLFLPVFFMGRLLPITYALLKKTKKNYGLICGYLYFFNTLGTVLGTIVIGYLAFYLFNLDSLLKINLLILITLGLGLALFEKKSLFTVLSFVLGVSVFFYPQWNRKAHHFGYFKVATPQEGYFKSFFGFPEILKNDVIFFKDGVNTTVSILQDQILPDTIKKAITPLFPITTDTAKPYTVVVNGKSDGHTLGDFSTMFLLSSLGYILAPKQKKLETAVIGLGTGVSAGVLGSLKDVNDISVLEISNQVIEGVKNANPDFNFHLFSNPKINVFEIDAFRYFTRHKKKYDLIVSEPSNPWLVGIENLFSTEFYELAKNSLNKEGILVQWMHTYNINEYILQMIFQTLKHSFKHIEVYQIGAGDLALLASNSPFKISKNRLQESYLQKFHKSFGLNTMKDLDLIKIINKQTFLKSQLFNNQNPLSFENPKLAYKSDKAFFLKKGANVTKTIPDFLFPKKEILKNKKDFEQHVKTINCLPRNGFNFFCLLIKKYEGYYNSYQDKKADFEKRLFSYHFLRKSGLTEENLEFLKFVKQKIITDKLKDPTTPYIFINHIMFKKNQAQSALNLFKERGVIDENTYNNLQKHIEETQKILAQNFTKNYLIKDR